jgi:DNA-binding NtrC family response regulator
MEALVASMSDAGRILIVDDNRDVLASLRRTLRRCQFSLTCVSDPREAVDLLENESFDLLLSDIDMPVISGHDLMEKAIALQPKMIRVFVTGAGSLEAAVRAINEGEVHRFVRKPYDARELRELVGQALARKAELDLASDAQSRAQRRQKLHQHLEAEHPGITEIHLDEHGVYCVAAEDLEILAGSLGMHSFV